MKFGVVLLLLRLFRVISFKPSSPFQFSISRYHSHTYPVSNSGFKSQDISSGKDNSEFQISSHEHAEQNRRSILQASTLLGLSLLIPDCVYAAENGGNLIKLQAQLKQARVQLDSIPPLIKDQKWDSVRAVLITPPLSDCWSKTGKLLQNYANAIGSESPDGDELAALELKEEALDHLRFLDMAVYNNVFNPIRTEGESGATKELIESYYSDPVREYNACIRVMDALIALSK